MGSAQNALASRRRPIPAVFLFFFGLAMLHITPGYNVIASQGEAPTFFPAVFFSAVLAQKNVSSFSPPPFVGLLDNHVPECALLVARKRSELCGGPTGH